MGEPILGVSGDDAVVSAVFSAALSGTLASGGVAGAGVGDTCSPVDGVWGVDAASDAGAG